MKIIFEKKIDYDGTWYNVREDEKLLKAFRDEKEAKKYYLDLVDRMKKQVIPQTEVLHETEITPRL